MEIEKSKTIKTLINQLLALKNIILELLNNASMTEINRYVSYKTMANKYNAIAECAVKELGLDNVVYYQTDSWKDFPDLIWPMQKAEMERVLIDTSLLLERIKCLSEYADDEVSNITNFISQNLRATIFDLPNKEREIQNSIETLLIGKGLKKGSDYDRETGKFNFSGKEYIPDFIIPSLNLCLEVKLLRNGHKSQIIEEINSDITAYSKQYSRLIFVVYDLGTIRNEDEFRRDIENISNVKLCIIKH